MLARTAYLTRTRAALRDHRCVALLGPRQCGKTTLARQLVGPESPNYFDLENPRHLARLRDPMLALESLRGLVVIDEIHRCPDLFPVLRVLADRRPNRARFLILGSSSPELIRQSSESLAGRLARIEMAGFGLTEVGLHNHRRHWLRGGFPLSYLAASDAQSDAWRHEFMRTFLERDVPQFGVTIPATTLSRFWAMTAHYHGQIWNASELARSLGVSSSTVSRYLDLLTDLLMVRQLQPWHANLGKRQVKSPKVYVRDSGLLHRLLGIRSQPDLLNHPKCGASFEGCIIEEVLRVVQPDEAWFWATHQGAELDLLMVKNGKRLGVECKFVDAPRFTPSMRIALTDLELDRLAVIYPGKQRYPLAERTEAVPMAAVLERGVGLFPRVRRRV